MNEFPIIWILAHPGRCKARDLEFENSDFEFRDFYEVPETTQHLQVPENVKKKKRRFLLPVRWRNFCPILRTCLHCYRITINFNSLELILYQQVPKNGYCLMFL